MTMRPAPLAISSIGLLAAWLGAALLVATVVAPAAFAVLPTRTLAGAVVGRVLPVIFWSGIGLGVVVALLGGRMGLGRFGVASSIVLAVASAAAQLGVAPRIEALRASIGGAVDALAVADPRRIAFGRMHGISVLLMGVGMIAASVALVMLSRHLSSRTIG